MKIVKHNAAFDVDQATDTDGTDRPGDDDGIKQHFFELFTRMSIEAGVPVPATLLDNFAGEAAEWIGGYDAFLDDDAKRLTRQRPPHGPPTGAAAVTVIEGGKRD
jgi:hypothetical protein